MKEESAGGKVAVAMDRSGAGLLPLGCRNQPWGFETNDVLSGWSQSAV